MCHVSPVACHVSPFTCHLSHVKKQVFNPIGNVAQTAQPARMIQGHLICSAGYFGLKDMSGLKKSWCPAAQGLEKKVNIPWPSKSELFCPASSVVPRGMWYNKQC